MSTGPVRVSSSPVLLSLKIIEESHVTTTMYFSDFEIRANWITAMGNGYCEALQYVETTT